jgi:hypothetical protein
MSFAESFEIFSGTQESEPTAALNGLSSEDQPEDIKTDFLIVGTGPAGAGLACFLSSNGNPPWRRVLHKMLRMVLTSAARTDRPGPEPIFWHGRYTSSPYHQHGCVGCVSALVPKGSCNGML